jgi:type IV secretory pathway VirB4 component
MAKSESLADYLQIWGFESDFIIFTDGSLGFMLDAEPVDISTWSDERTNSYAESTSQFLNSLPSGLDIQFVQDITSGNLDVINQHQSLSQNANNPVAKSLCEKRVALLKNADQNGEIPTHRLKVIIRKSMAQELVEKPKLFSKEKLFQDISEKKLTREIELLKRTRDNIISSLELLGIQCKPIESDKIADILYRQWNPSRNISLGSYDPSEVRQNLLYSDVGIDLSGFVIGTTQFRVLSLKALPDNCYSAMAVKLRELPFKSQLFITIHSPDQAKEIKALQTDRRVAYAMVVGKKSGVSDLESAAKFQDLEGLLEEMIAQGQKVFHVSVTVILQSDSELDLDNQVDLTLSKFRELGGAEAMSETLAAFEIFSKVSLPNARNKERNIKIKTTNLADLIPLYGPWGGHESAQILLKTRFGSLLKFSPFDVTLASANQLISGGSGSGKSVMTNLLLLQMLKENPKVFFIDIGGSYKKLTENLSGQYVELGVNDKLSVNPFDLATGEIKPSSHKIKFLVGLIELMTKEEGAERIPKLARAEIEDALVKVYNLHQMPKLSHLRALLLAHKDPEIQNYGKILYPWCGDTPYGKFLDRDTTVEFAKDIVAFDLKGLETYPDLQSVCLYIITDLVWREIQKDRSIMKFIIFDECWKLLRDEAAIIFIEEIFRTVRKYFCSATAISQDLSDFLNSKISSALLPNCSIKWLLMQNQSDFTKIKEALGLNENEIALIQSLRQKKGEFSEAFLLAGPERRVVAVIEPTPLELWIATTDPRDLSAIEKLKKRKTSFITT